MDNDISSNLAEVAAIQALEKVYKCIDNNKSFKLEAGAGAGKTYSLIKALNYLIKQKGSELIRKHQKIACITYTNVAKNQIDIRTDRHPVVHSDTIHAFCWALIRNFQPELRTVLPKIGKWPERLAELGQVDIKFIDYDLGYPSVEEGVAKLHHDDVLSLTVDLFKNQKFRELFISRYPILFIDEYQDTDNELMEAIKNYFLGKEPSPLIGFFGDHWQKIYGNGCGKIEHSAIELIDKNSNFRSVNAVVSILNNMRPELNQQVEDSSVTGSAEVFHTNSWVGERRKDKLGHWTGDLPPNVSHEYLKLMISHLTENGWDFSKDKTKILMLTHNILADEQEYRNLADVFEYNDGYIKKQDKHIAFFADVLEPICSAYNEKKYGQMFTILGGKKLGIGSYKDKLEWKQSMDKLVELRSTGLIGDVVDFLRLTNKPRLPESIENKERELEQFMSVADAEDPKPITHLKKLRNVPYKEVISIANFINENTPFATQHSVKGAEFENVLIIFGRGWNRYNFGQMLEWVSSGIPDGKQETFERSRNLFYVVCSRPKKRLALLFTQELSNEAIKTLTQWFGEQAVHSLDYK